MNMNHRAQPPLPALDLSEISERLLGVVDDLRGASILVTGGTGFVGTWLVESFLHLDQAANLGARMVVLTRDADAYATRSPHLVSDPRLSVHVGTLGVAGAFAGLDDITHIIHAGSDINRRMSPAEALEALRTLDQGTEDLLQAAETWPTKRFLYISSAAVYGRSHENLTMHEDCSNCPSVLGPESTYGMGKRIAELRACLHASSMGYAAVVARLGAFIGPMLPLDGGFAAGNFIADALAGRRIQIQGDGTAVRCYQYAADLTIWLWRLLLNGKSGEAYNVGGEIPVSIRELAACVARIVGNQGVNSLGCIVPGQPADRYCPSVEKATRELGLENRIGLEVAVRRTLSWHSARSGLQTEQS
jgi:dTDP-glucose 4,6-dehydratase